MNKKEWYAFYSALRQQMRLGWSINTFSMDISISFCLAVQCEARRFELWEGGLQRRLWDLALTLYGLPPEEKLLDWYWPITTEWREKGWILRQMREEREKE